MKKHLLFEDIEDREEANTVSENKSVDDKGEVRWREEVKIPETNTYLKR